ncbi:MAG: flagellin [Spirochaetota bacterium]|nr:flagellin [Spirochaetota bacterium]
MVINHNMSAMFAHRTMQGTMIDGEKSIQKLASGERINRAGDDASGLAVSEKMRSQIRGLVQAGRNAQNGISFLQTAEGYMDETSQIFNRIRELAVQSANGIYSTEDRMMMQVEVSQLVDEVDRIAKHAQFNGMNLLTGRFGKLPDAYAGNENYAPARVNAATLDEAGTQFHIGANMDQREQVFLGDMTARALKFVDDADQVTLKLDTPGSANKVIGQIDAAYNVVMKQRADLGAYQNRFEYAVKGIAIAAENLQAAESRIRDTDMAEEMTNYIRSQILMQSGVSMLAHASMQPQAALRLFD